ncbi:MAG TPA: transposase, partial [Candidatus Angelobacter sp.]|nr:transposase [Candidatus Angelobacter sp.]
MAKRRWSPVGGDTTQITNPQTKKLNRRINLLRRRLLYHLSPNSHSIIHEAQPMAHSYAQNHIHLVFSTKNRLNLIPKELQPRLWAYIAGICKNNNMLSFAVGGMTDHIHVLFRLPPTLPLIRAVTLIKSNSSKWLRAKGLRFAWQQGYGAFSVS